MYKHGKQVKCSQIKTRWIRGGKCSRNEKIKWLESKSVRIIIPTSKNFRIKSDFWENYWTGLYFFLNKWNIHTEKKWWWQQGESHPKPRPADMSLNAVFYFSCLCFTFLWASASGYHWPCCSHQQLSEFSQGNWKLINLKCISLKVSHILLPVCSITKQSWAVISRVQLKFGCTNSMDMSLSKLQEIVKDREAWHAVVHGITKSQMRLSNWTARTA